MINEDAVSPVIDVILMVAITVILDTVIATFVFTIEPPIAAPQASFALQDVDGSGNGTDIKLIANGGESIKLSDCIIKVNSSIVTSSLSDGIIDSGDVLILFNSKVGIIPISLMYNPNRQFIFNNKIRVV